MPPKKDKKKKAKPKPRKKVIRMVPPPQQALPKLPTGFNRDIPFGAGGGGSGNLIAAIASRPQPPSQPLQTPDQFNAIQDSRRAADLLKEVVGEQVRVKEEKQAKRGRPFDKDKAAQQGITEAELKAARSAAKGKAVSSMPTGAAKSITEMAGGEQPPPLTGTIDMGGSAAPSGMIIDLGIPKRGRPTKKGVETMPPSTPPPFLKGDSMLQTAPLTEGGRKPQQGLFMGTEGKLLSAPADFSSSLVGADPISASEGMP
jgi:hypothetical protein